MANAARLLSALPIRLLLMGYPGSGKTGALASLVNAGFKLRIIDFDGNPESLLRYADPKMLENVDIVSFEDPIAFDGVHVVPKGIPTAFARSFKILDSWKYKEADGTEVDLGSSKDWGPDTIVVVDGLTGQGKAAFHRAMAAMNRKPGNVSSPVWGMAMAEQLAFTQRVTAETNRHHTIVLSHLRMIGPKEIGDREDDHNKEIKRSQADMIPTRLWPSALGRELPQQIGGEFPCCVLADVETRGKQVLRRLYCQPRSDMSLKMPARDVEKLQGLPIETGLATIFAALGHPGPQVK